MFLVATLMNSLGAILSPVFSNLDFAALIAIRIMQGLGGVSFLPPPLLPSLWLGALIAIRIMQGLGGISLLPTSSLAGAHSSLSGSCRASEG